jgi:hypothetical protein
VPRAVISIRWPVPQLLLAPLASFMEAMNRPRVGGRLISRQRKSVLSYTIFTLRSPCNGTAEEISTHYDLMPVGETGECPCCGYRGFTVTEKDGRTLFYCHAGGCTQGEIMSVLRDAGLWGQSATALFEAIDWRSLNSRGPRYPTGRDTVELHKVIGDRSSHQPCPSLLIREQAARLRGFLRANVAGA